VFITGVNDTSNKLFIGVNDIGDKLIAGVIVPGDKLLPVFLKRRLRLVPDFHRFHDTFMRKLRNNKSIFLIGLGFIGHF
jgi:hypothetical protein